MEQRVFEMFSVEGLAPSQIDKKLKLIDGLARRIIVTYWRKHWHQWSAL